MNRSFLFPCRSLKPWTLGGLALAGLLQMACGGSSAADSNHRKELTVRRGELTERILLTGELVAEDAVALITPNANIWPVQIRWLAEDGTEVQEGDVVVEFDNSQLTANLEPMRARVVEESNQLISMRSRLSNDRSEARYDFEQKQAAHEKAKLDAKIPAEIQARIEYERLQLELRRKELELKEAERKLETVVEAGKAELSIQEIALEEARREMEKAEASIARLALKAPRSGILLVGQDPREGRTFQSGDNSFPGTAVARMPDLETIIVEARLFDVDDGRVLVGRPVVAALDSFPGEVLNGEVRQVEGIAQKEGRSQRQFFRVLVDLEEIDVERMRPGMSVKLEIASEVHRDVLLVPRRALTWVEGKPHAVRANGSVEVELGACDLAECVVLSGLDEGDALVAAGLGGVG